MLLQRHWHTHKQYIKNLSNEQLTDKQITLLWRGLKFIPTLMTKENLVRRQLLAYLNQFPRQTRKTNIACRPEEVEVVFRLTESFHEECFPFNQKKKVSHKFWASFFSTKDFAHGFLLQILLDRYLVGSTLRRMLFYGNESTLSASIQENRLSCISYRVFSIQPKSKAVSQTRDGSNGKAETLFLGATCDFCAILISQTSSVLNWKNLTIIF